MAWDNELDRRIRAAEASEVERMARRQINVALGLQEAAALELQALVDRIKYIDQRAKREKRVRQPIAAIKDIVRMVEAGTKLERVNRGEPDTIVENRSPPMENLEALSVEELEAYRALLAKMRDMM